MAIVSMADAVSGQVASSAEYNKVTANVRDIDGRLGAVVSTNSVKTRLDAIDTKNTSQDTSISSLGTRVTALENKPYVRYDLTSQTVTTTGSYTWLTFDTPTEPDTTSVGVTSNFFILKLAGKWLVTVGLCTANGPVGNYRFQISANLTGTTGTSYGAYGSGYNGSAASIPIPPMTKVVRSDGTGQVGARLLVPASATLSGTSSNFIEMTYLGA